HLISHSIQPRHRSIIKTDAIIFPYSFISTVFPTSLLYILKLSLVKKSQKHIGVTEQMLNSAMNIGAQQEEAVFKDNEQGHEEENNQEEVEQKGINKNNIESIYPFSALKASVQKGARSSELWEEQKKQLQQAQQLTGGLIHDELHIKVNDSSDIVIKTDESEKQIIDEDFGDVDQNKLKKGKNERKGKKEGKRLRDKQIGKVDNKKKEQLISVDEFLIDQISVRLIPHAMRIFIQAQQRLSGEGQKQQRADIRQQRATLAQAYVEEHQRFALYAHGISHFVGIGADDTGKKDKRDKVEKEQQEISSDQRELQDALLLNITIIHYFLFYLFLLLLLIELLIVVLFLIYSFKLVFFAIKIPNCASYIAFNLTKASLNHQN
ncbi:MAG: hypothetical protein EZS28_047996, partial [Streblomastix strix]